MSIEVMRQALEALESYEQYIQPLTNCFGGPEVPREGSASAKVKDAITALRAAIEQAEKPVAWRWKEVKGEFVGDWVLTEIEPPPYVTESMPLYTAPREWVELTDDEARALVNRATFGDRTNWQALVYIVDQKLKEKNRDQ
jgi:hypothetical protein